MPQPRFQLGEWRVSPEADLLEREGLERRLQPQVTRLLVHLAERAGSVVTREELLREVWEERFVSDAVLTTAVWELRAALEDDSRNPRYLETVPKRGYRLLVHPTAADKAAEARPAAAGRLPRWLVPVTLSLAAAAWWIARGADVSGWRTSETSTTLAVLPIDNFSGDATQDYLAAGLTDTLITELARLSGLRVISRTSVMRYAGEPRRVPEIGRELAVETILEGAIVRSGSRIRLTVQLIDAESDHHLWTESYERELVDVIALQNELARAVARQIRLQFTPEDARRFDQTAGPSAAVDSWLRGLSFLAADPYDADAAIAAFETAVAADPGFARAWADLAMAMAGAAWEYSKTPHEVVDGARQAAARAVELDPSIGRAHFALAAIHDGYDWDWEAAEDGYRRAVRLDPSNAVARRVFAQFLAERGRFDEAIAEAQAARACDPGNPSSRRTLGWVHYLARDYPEALRLYREAAAMAPGNFGLVRELALMLAETGDSRAALAQLEALDSERPGDFHTLALLAMIRARAGDAGAARADLDRLLELAARAPVLPTALAKVYAWLGEHDQAFAWLDRALAERSPALIQLGVNPQFDPLRPDPRLDEVLRRIGLVSDRPPDPRSLSTPRGGRGTPPPGTCFVERLAALRPPLTSGWGLPRLLEDRVQCEA